MFGSLNPIHWLLLGAVLLCAALGVYSNILSGKLERCSLENRVIEVVGEAQEDKTKSEDLSSKENKQEVEKEYENTIADLQLTNKRLRDKIAGSRVLPPAPQVCTDNTQTTEIDWPLIEQSLREYRQRVRELAEEGDKAIIQLDTAKEWLDKEES